MIVPHKNRKFSCIYCGKKYDTEAKAKECVDKHDIILLPVARADLNMLLHFFFFRKDAYLPQNLVKIVQRYNKQSALKQMRRD